MASSLMKKQIGNEVCKIFLQSHSTVRPQQAGDNLHVNLFHSLCLQFTAYTNQNYDWATLAVVQTAIIMWFSYLFHPVMVNQRSGILDSFS